MSVLGLPCAEQNKMLASAAYYRACGASWNVVASHFEMPLAEVMAFIHAAGPRFERMVEFQKKDLEFERRARHRSELRRALSDADSISSKCAAARAIMTYWAKEERAWIKQQLADVVTRSEPCEKHSALSVGQASSLSGKERENRQAGNPNYGSVFTRMLR